MKGLHFMAVTHLVQTPDCNQKGHRLHPCDLERASRGP